jgi:Fe-S-cluster containining protein
MSVESRLDALYKTLPGVQCRGFCKDSCGPIAASRAEVERIEKVADKRLAVGEDLTCSMLDADGRCVVYAVRPMICRLFGTVEKLKCPHGCVPERWLSEALAMRKIDAALRVGGAEVASRMKMT